MGRVRRRPQRGRGRAARTCGDQSSDPCATQTSSSPDGSTPRLAPSCGLATSTSPPEAFYEHVIKDPTCPACELDEYGPVTRPQVRERDDGTLVVVRDVPVRECPLCGHTVFDLAVLERFTSIVAAAPAGTPVIVIR
ncbi:YgiT-type zinc finger protein [Janibacter sp. G368]|uniref:YgiT-type zinc finger protein n=1 Tax=Janibacter sp. G368 TaxID=3420441 RepID=UPI003CFDF9D5